MEKRRMETKESDISLTQPRYITSKDQAYQAEVIVSKSSSELTYIEAPL